MSSRWFRPERKRQVGQVFFLSVTVLIAMSAYHLVEPFWSMRAPDPGTGNIYPYIFAPRGGHHVWYTTQRALIFHQISWIVEYLSISGAVISAIYIILLQKPAKSNNI